jgi:hypothetical protein
VVTAITYQPIYAVTGEGDYVYVAVPDSDLIQVYKYTAGSPLATQPAQAPPAATLYPNPSGESEPIRLTLPTRTATASTATIYDSRGRLLQEQDIPSGSTQVQLTLPGLAAGLYIVRCGTVVQKFIRH